MASTWKGQTRGGVLGYKIFIFVLTRFGLKPAYFVLRIVTLYYLFFSFKSTSSIFYYFHKVLKYSFIKSLSGVYKTYNVFGETLIDKVAIRSGLGKHFTFEMDGEENLHEMASGKQGGVMISAHVGNWDTSGHMLTGRLNTKMHIVMYDAEHQNIKKYLENVTGGQEINVIVVKEDFSHIFHISKALANKELICIHGDRYVQGSKVIATQFLGRTTYFPYGAFHLAAKLKVPYTFIFGFKEKNNHYHFFSTKLKTNNGGVRAIVEEYSAKLEELIKKYPEQWFNFYDYWAEPPKELIVEE